MRWLHVLTATSLLLGSATALSQTTQAVSVDPWPATLEQLAAVMMEGRADAVNAMLSDKATVRSFGGSPGSEEVDRMVVHASLSAPIGIHAYVHPPLVMAADLMADCKNADLPDSVRQRMVPQDDASMQRANATAAQWISDSIDAATGDRVGVLVFFEPTDALRAARGFASNVNSSGGELIFVLVRAQAGAVASPAAETLAPTAIRIDRIVYGNPLLENSVATP